jgi:hypothetical protein
VNSDLIKNVQPWLKDNAIHHELASFERALDYEESHLQDSDTRNWIFAASQKVLAEADSEQTAHFLGQCHCKNRTELVIRSIVEGVCLLIFANWSEPDKCDWKLLSGVPPRSHEQGPNCFMPESMRKDTNRLYYFSYVTYIYVDGFAERQARSAHHCRRGNDTPHLSGNIISTSAGPISTRSSPGYPRMRDSHGTPSKAQRDLLQEVDGGSGREPIGVSRQHQRLRNKSARVEHTFWTATLCICYRAGHLPLLSEQTQGLQQTRRILLHSCSKDRIDRCRPRARVTIRGQHETRFPCLRKMFRLSQDAAYAKILIRSFGNETQRVPDHVSRSEFGLFLGDPSATQGNRCSTYHALDWKIRIRAYTCQPQQVYKPSPSRAVVDSMDPSQ